MTIVNLLNIADRLKLRKTIKTVTLIRFDFTIKWTFRPLNSLKTLIKSLKESQSKYLDTDTLLFRWCFCFGDPTGVFGGLCSREHSLPLPAAPALEKLLLLGLNEGSLKEENIFTCTHKSSVH